MNKVQVEILGLSSTPSAGGAYAILLKEVYGVRRLPIIIGAFEAQAIALEIEGIKPPRPLTHDLLKNIIDNLGAAVQEILIDELRDNTFFAKIVLEVSSLTNDVDSRPSDAIALAVRTQSPIFVNEEVMKAAAFIPSGEEEASENLEENLPDEEPTERQAPSGSKESKLASLQNQLREALEKEDYERAARIRDEIKKMTDQN
ncbi:MAG: bifunctional nuclease family protein [Ignavibacteria bacterium]|nr:bifunctional nuclease family protein [Ignavibacteria bacterium]MCU7505056.1 bifunctional nuclease family protein [Ignavibacteria bacterium]MCU7515304.1 bifunctional nuclease family protein [Ignavibacteria bacterium]